MRDALAARSGALVQAGPRRKPAPAGAVWRMALAAVRRRPGPIAGGLAAAAAASLVALNALTFQTRRHPAPLFAPKVQAGAAVAATPLPPARPAPVPAAAGAAAAPAKPAAPGRDPIGDVIRTGTTGSARSPETRAAPARSAAVQRALNRLGYGPLKADGVIGDGTRQALERFERDRRLPLTRDLSPRTLRELSAHAGLPIE